MNIKSACILIMLAIPVSLQAFEHGENKSDGTCKNENGTTRCNLSSTGTINLSQTRNNAKTKNIVFTLNNNVKGVLKLHQIKVERILEPKTVFDSSPNNMRAACWL